MANADELPRPRKKYFTVESANKMLPLVRSIATDIVEKYRQLNEQCERTMFLQGVRPESMSAAHREEVEQIGKDIEQAKEELAALIDELRRLGVDLKGPDGLVDFPSMLDNREVCLCWKVGEAEVMYWHELEAGFAGRQSLKADMISRSGRN